MGDPGRRATRAPNSAIARARAKLDERRKTNPDPISRRETGANSFATVLPRATGSGCFQRVRAGRDESRTTRDVCKAAPALTFSDRARIVRFPCASANFERRDRQAGFSRTLARNRLGTEPGCRRRTGNPLDCSSYHRDVDGFADRSSRRRARVLAARSDAAGPRARDVVAGSLGAARARCRRMAAVVRRDRRARVSRGG